MPPKIRKPQPKPVSIAAQQGTFSLDNWKLTTTPAATSTTVKIDPDSHHQSADKIDHDGPGSCGLSVKNA